MNVKPASHLRTAAAVLIPAAALLCAAPGHARDSAAGAIAAWGTTLPQERQADGVAYTSGGDDYTQAKVFEKSLDKYPLAVELLEKSGKVNEFTADARVRIADLHGKTVFSTRSDGPFMLIKLPPGRYTMDATLGKITLHKSDLVVLPGKTERATFIFPPRADAA